MIEIDNAMTTTHAQQTAVVYIVYDGSGHRPTAARHCS